MLHSSDLTQVLEAAGLEATEISIRKNRHLFRTGDPVVRMHFVLDGLAVMTRVLENGQELVVQRAGPGDLFAEASLFSEQYHCDALAGTNLSCAVFSKADVLAALEKPEVSFAVLKVYSHTIRNLRSQIELRNIKRADDRVLAYLHMIPVDGTGWRCPHLSWKDIARTLGLTHEACYRALALLVRNGRIEKSDGRFRLV